MPVDRQFTSHQLMFLVVYLPQFERIRLNNDADEQRVWMLDRAEEFICLWPPSTELPLDEYEEEGKAILRVRSS